MRLMRLLLFFCAPVTLAVMGWAQPPAVTGKVVTEYSMRYIDVKPGTGKLAEPGKVYIVRYTGYLKDGTKFDATPADGRPFGFEQGKRQVIAGWDTGFEGMRVGGKRRLLVPYQLGYGANGRGKIPPKADLIFDVELLDVRDSMPQ
jgi:peptidylprolyl isomerase